MKQDFDFEIAFGGPIGIVSTFKIYLFRCRLFEVLKNLKKKLFVAINPLLKSSILVEQEGYHLEKVSLG